MKWFQFSLIICFCFFTLSAPAQMGFSLAQSEKIQIFPAIFDIRYDKDQNQIYDQRYSQDIIIGERTDSYSAMIEYSNYKIDSGNITLNTSKQHREVTVWRKSSFIQQHDFRFFWGAGIGGYDESVTTTLYGIANTNRSGVNFMGGLSVGMEIDFLDYIVMNLEGRTLFCRDFDPNPQPGLIWRLGVQF